MLQYCLSCNAQCLDVLFLYEINKYINMVQQSPHQILSDLANRDTGAMVQQSPHQILSDQANRDTGAMVQQSPHQILSDLANRDQCNMYNILPRTLLISNAFLVNCLLDPANYVMTY